MLSKSTWRVELDVTHAREAERQDEAVEPVARPSCRNGPSPSGSFHLATVSSVWECSRPSSRHGVTVSLFHVGLFQWIA
jgi:hypothetical protein